MGFSGWSLQRWQVWVGWYGVSYNFIILNIILDLYHIQGFLEWIIILSVNSTYWFWQGHPGKYVAWDMSKMPPRVHQPNLSSSRPLITQNWYIKYKKFNSLPAGLTNHPDMADSNPAPPLGQGLIDISANTFKSQKSQKRAIFDPLALTSRAFCILTFLFTVLPVVLPPRFIVTWSQIVVLKEFGWAKAHS